MFCQPELQMRLKLRQLTDTIQVTLHVSDMGIVGAVALHLVENFEEDGQDGFTPARASALLSMLKRITSVLDATARFTSANNMAS